MLGSSSIEKAQAGLVVRKIRLIPPPILLKSLVLMFFSCSSKQNRAKVDGKTNGLHHSRAHPGSKWNWNFFFEKILRKKFGMKKWSAAFFCSTSSDDRAQPRWIQNFGNWISWTTESHELRGLLKLVKYLLVWMRWTHSWLFICFRSLTHDTRRILKYQCVGLSWFHRAVNEASDH